MYETGLRTRIGAEPWRAALRAQRRDWRGRARFGLVLALILGAPASMLMNMAAGAGGGRIIGFAVAWAATCLLLLALHGRPGRRRVFRRR